MNWTLNLFAAAVFLAGGAGYVAANHTAARAMMVKGDVPGGVVSEVMEALGPGYRPALREARADVRLYAARDWASIASDPVQAALCAPHCAPGSDVDVVIVDVMAAPRPGPRFVFLRYGEVMDAAGACLPDAMIAATRNRLADIETACGAAPGTLRAEVSRLYEIRFR